MIVLLPVYQPRQHLTALVSDLHEAMSDASVVVVDDGSGPSSGPVLDAARQRGCAVLRHDVNRGKGAALKTGFRYAAETHPGHDVVCADADGQHQAADVLRVVEHVRRSSRMVLGVRHFEGRVPLRSRVGNHLTRLLFRAAAGRRVRDTQTGLRGYPASLLGWLQSVPGERFDYEMNVLLHAARAGHPIDEILIATNYGAANAPSHFGAVSDSARIYWPLLRFVAERLTATRTAGEQR
jgi:glycosyltransferase involved in cell wall biosynthesis